MIVNTSDWAIRKFWRKLRSFFQEILRQNASIKLRLWIYVSLVATQFIVFMLMVLLTAGVFNFSKNTLKLSLEMQQQQLQQNLSKHLERLNLKGRYLAHSLEALLQAWCIEESCEPEQLKGQPQKIERLLAQTGAQLLQQLADGSASGSFIMLDVSHGAGAADERAGLFMRNLEPNSVSLNPPNIWLKYGPFSVSKKLGIRILPQWRMECSASMYQLFLRYQEKTADESGEKSSYTHYLSPAQSLGESEDPAFYLCFPLHGPKGELFGLCGFEVNAMHFKLLYNNNYAKYPNTLALLAPTHKDNLLVSNGLVSAQTPYFANKNRDDQLSLNSEDASGLKHYRGSKGESFMGLTTPISIYAKESPFQDEKWSVSVLIPQRDFALEESAQRLKLLLWLLVGFAASFVLLVLLSTLYMKPIQRTLQQIINGSASAAIQRTGILEIDDLLIFLKEKEGQIEPPSETDPSEPAPLRPRISAQEAEAFRQRIASLSPAEKAVFELYIEGRRAKEITELLHLSINTIKTHNKRIYMKLDVSSRRELLDYVYFLEDKAAAASGSGTDDGGVGGGA